MPFVVTIVIFEVPCMIGLGVYETLSMVALVLIEKISAMHLVCTLLILVGLAHECYNQELALPPR